MGDSEYTIMKQGRKIILTHNVVKDIDGKPVCIQTFQTEKQARQVADKWKSKGYYYLAKKKVK